MSPSSDRERPRRFVGKIRLFNEARRREFADAGFPVVPEDQHQILEDYLDISRRRRSTLMPLFKLQLHMLQDLFVAEQSIGRCRQAKAELLGHTQSGNGEVVEDMEPEDDAIDSEGSGDDAAASMNPELRSINREIYFLKAEARALRDLGDGIAWRLFDYDRGVLQELARRPGKKQINRSGIEAELYTLASYFNERSGTALLNDLTHFPKFGDVTVRRDSGEFEIVEVKAGTSGSGRLTRQRQGLTELVSLLSMDQGREIAGQPVTISSAAVKPEMFAGNLQGLLDRAANYGSAVEAIGSHLIVECMDFLAVRDKKRDKEQVFAILDRGRAVRERWKASGDFVLPYDLQSRYAHAQNFAPLSIFPLAVQDCVRLMAGTVTCLIFLNVSTVLRELEDRGWKVIKSPSQLVSSAEVSAREIPIAVLQKGRLNISVPAPLFSRLSMDFLKPKSLAQLLDAILEQRGEAGYQFLNLDGEPRMWR